jgi:hypothetical protein
MNREFRVGDRVRHAPTPPHVLPSFTSTAVVVEIAGQTVWVEIDDGRGRAYYPPEVLELV